MKVDIYTIIFLLLINLFSLSVKGQTPVPSASPGDVPPPSQILKKGIAENNYLAPLLELREREAEYLASRRRKGQYLDYMALINSYVGDYAALYEYEEKFLESLEPVNRMRASFAKEITGSPIDGYQLHAALAAIASMADGQQVIMINEEHRTPLHRAFTLQLLPLLYAGGFRYFAAETLNKSDAAELNRRGYPTQKSGTYSADPVYGDLIRTALKFGFKVVPYEVDDLNCTPKPDNPLSCQDERERGQAQNLYDRILKQDPQAKIFVHAGRDHNAETQEEGFSMMAWHFSDITKINPFTIDQMHLSERRNPADEEPLYRYVTGKWKLTQPTVFKSADGDFWKAGTNHDLKVFHPRARYENNRPTWLRLGGLRKPHRIDFKKLRLTVKRNKFDGQEPILVQAFVAGESADAVPVDQIILYPNKEISVFMLPKGNFRIRAMDKSGKVIGGYKVS
jgi:hypothetical protein